MNDRELLELAAKAAGYETWRGRDHQDEMLFMRLKNPDPTGKCSGIGWNPLTDDGDALRLAVKLRLDVMFFEGLQEVHSAHCTVDFSATGESYGENVDAATRRAITRAAAEIGRSMK